MHVQVGVFSAKAKLSELLREVAHGQSYTITQRGRPIADLVPCAQSSQANVYDAVENMRSIHKIVGIAPEEITEWISTGRK